MWEAITSIICRHGRSSGQHVISAKMLPQISPLLEATQHFTHWHTAPANSGVVQSEALGFQAALWQSSRSGNNLIGYSAALAALASLLSAHPAFADAPQQASPQGQPNPSMPFSETAVHPLDYDPVTNEHTAKMTMARAAAMEYYSQGRYKQAEAKFKEALQEAQLGFDARDPHIPCAINMLAEFYRNTGQFEQAEQLYNQALEQLESIYGEKHWLYASALHNLALSYEMSGRLDDAQAAMSRVMQLRRVMFGERHFLYADSMFALGVIFLKQAEIQKQKAGNSDSNQAGATKRSWFGGWKSSSGTSSNSQIKALEKQGLNMMSDATQILEDAETVQVNQLVGWLTELGQQYQQRGMVREALQCAKKCMHQFISDKGEQHAKASELSDMLIESLLAAGEVQEARDAAAECAAARQQVFGRELAVAHAWLRLAQLEMKLPKGQQNLEAALQHARNAAALSGDLLADYSRASVKNWMGKQGQDKSVKRARAALLNASSYRFLAENTPSGTQQDSNLELAVSALESGIKAAKQQLQQLSSGSGTEGILDELAGLLVEQQLLLVDCLDMLQEQLSSSAAKGDTKAAARQQAVKAQLDALLETLLPAQ